MSMWDHGAVICLLCGIMMGLQAWADTSPGGAWGHAVQVAKGGQAVAVQLAHRTCQWLCEAACVALLSPARSSPALQPSLLLLHLPPPPAGPPPLLAGTPPLRAAQRQRALHQPGPPPLLLLPPP